MGTWKKKNSYTNKVSYISVPAQIIKSVSSSSLTHNKSSKKNTTKFLFLLLRNPKLWAFCLLSLSVLGIVSRLGPCLSPSGPHQESQLQSSDSIAYTRSNSTHAEIPNADDPSLDMIPKPPVAVVEKNETFGGDSKLIITSKHVLGDENEFWKQPDGLGYKPCLDFSSAYRRESKRIVRERRKYLMVVVSGGMNQQKNQIVDAVVIARILGAVLVVPVLQVNLIWGDER